MQPELGPPRVITLALVTRVSGLSSLVPTTAGVIMTGEFGAGGAGSPGCDYCSL